MRIKQILLSGFKSYRSQEKFDDFHSRTNVLVGKNGSGKSNIIFAIRFVLSSEFLHLRPEDRKSLIHQGKENIVSGFVEIVFDNTDKRFPVDSTEVRLRRNIGLTKSDFLLNGKHITPDDVMNLLESAGLSRSNPYYIVQQGKVRALAQMKPEERLEVLRDVAGTKVYDERRAESVKIMEETKGRKVKIEETTKILDERLGELEQEKAELNEYQELDRTRRTLEFTIYTKEIVDLTEQLQSLDDVRNQEVNEASELHKQTAEVREEIKSLEKESKTLAVEIEKLSKERSLLLGERDADMQTKARKELELQSLTSTHSEQSDRFKSVDNQIKQLEKEIAKAQKTLASVNEKFQHAQNEEADLKEKAVDHERRIRELHGRQGRAAQFKTQKERDDWIDKEVSEIASALKSKREQQKKMTSDVDKLMAQIESEKEKLSKKSQSSDSYRALLEELSNQAVHATENRDKAANRRKELWREEADANAELQQITDGISKYERQLFSTLSKEQAQGLEAVKRLKSEHPRELSGVYAPLIELFTCTEEETVAVETTAKSQLFNVVVDTDETAAKLLDLLNQERAGRVTFMPLNKLTVKETKHPRTDNAVPLIDRLKFKPLYRKAFLQIFGRTLLCPTLEEAAAISRQHNVDCVTVDGDEVSRKGALSGGFIDRKRSRIATMNGLRESREKYEGLNRQLDQIHKELQQCDAQITKYLGELETVERRRTEHRHAFESSSVESSAAQKQVLALQSQQQRLEAALTALALGIKQLEESEKSLKAEKSTKLVSKLTKEEETLLRSLTGELVDLQNQLADHTNTRAQLQAQRTVEEMRLTQNLLTQLRELERDRASINLGEEERKRIALQSEVDSLEESIARADERLGELDDELAAKNKAQDAVRRKLDEAHERETDSLKQLQDESGAIDKSLSSRSVIAQKREEAQRKLREVGSIPSQLQKQYEKKPVPQLVKQLHEVRKQLKGFAHINKKALDQYVFFKDQREQLQQRKDELDKSENAIEDLIEALDQKKEAAIERTFKMVAKFFEEVFHELTQHGKAQLVMQKSDQAEGEEESGDTESAVRHYRGIDIAVSFTKSGKPQRMHQLSGGQQSLVALALIFAIQRCDPAPFYVFDEIDAALDDTHRLSVAEMIQKQSETTQFILTTHRPEMIQHAQKHYLIKFQNKVSSIVTCEQEDALEVVQHDEGDDINGEPQQDHRDSQMDASQGDFASEL